VAPPGVGPVSVVVTTPDGGPSQGNELFDYDSGAPEFGRCEAAPVTGSCTNSSCQALTDLGEIASTQTVAGVTIRFTGCVSGSQACTSSGAGTGEVITGALQGALGFVSKSNGAVALELWPAGQPFMQYTCAGAAPTTVTGSLLIPLKVGKMGTATKLTAKGKRGKQKPEAFEGGEQDVLSSSTGGGPAQATDLAFAGTLRYEEALEINPAV
jgi:hypothetical protein